MDALEHRLLQKIEELEASQRIISDLMGEVGNYRVMWITESRRARILSQYVPLEWEDYPICMSQANFNSSSPLHP